MKWMEIIKLQIAREEKEQVLQEIKELLETIGSSSGMMQAAIYEEGTLYGDLAVLLIWETPSLNKNGSREALQLKQLFREFGLVNHTVWLLSATLSVSKVK